MPASACLCLGQLLSRVWLLLLLLLSATSTALGQEVRPPVYSGLFYPAQAEQLSQQINSLLDQARQQARDRHGQQPLRALVMPHAGYIFSGPTAAHAALQLAGQQYDKVILLGPDHYAGLHHGGLTSKEAMATPLGLVPLHPDAQQLRRQSSLYSSSPLSDQKEHCLEVVLPFLQTMLPDLQIIPIVVGPGNMAAMAASLHPLLTSRTLLVVSSDLSHYLPQDLAHERDQETIHGLLNLDATILQQGSNRACGIWPLTILLKLATDLGWQGKLLDYRTSGDSPHGDRQRVVGYAALAFYGSTDSHSSTLSGAQGQTLVELARFSLETLFSPQGSDTQGPLAEALQDPTLQAKQGTFVTLTKSGQLRGCIGSLDNRLSLLEGTQRHARLAALHDPRFPPLQKEELAQIDIEVSVLTPATPLLYQDANDLLAKLRPGIDGVILRSPSGSATFLPQVWQQLPQAEQFLSQLCAKAGLPALCWQEKDLEISTYQVQFFHEQDTGR